MVRTAEQNAALSAATRDIVQTAALRVFAHKGYAASAIRDIAVEAGVSVGTIYRHYPTKDTLYAELLDMAMHGLLALADELSRPGRPADLVRGFTARFLSTLTSDDGAAEFVMVVNQGLTTGVQTAHTEQVLNAHRTMWRAFTDLVRRGQEAGDFAGGDPEQLTTCYFATLGGLTGFRVGLGSEFIAPDVEVVLRTLMRGQTD